MLIIYTSNSQLDFSYFIKLDSYLHVLHKQKFLDEQIAQKKTVLLKKIPSSLPSSLITFVRYAMN